jgi:capsular polysaccharide biosynthesis protein
MVALAGGLVAGFAAAVLRDRLDQSIRTAGDVRRWARLEVLAVLPERA